MSDTSVYELRNAQRRLYKIYSERTGINRMPKFQKGVSGNPLGRPKGSRNKFAGQFVDDLRAEWDARGMQALKELSGPDLVKAAIAILPKDVLISTQQQQQGWVINALPYQSLEQWAKDNNITIQDESQDQKR